MGVGVGVGVASSVTLARLRDGHGDGDAMPRTRSRVHQQKNVNVVGIAANRAPRHRISRPLPPLHPANRDSSRPRFGDAIPVSTWISYTKKIWVRFRNATSVTTSAKFDSGENGHLGTTPHVADAKIEALTIAIQVRFRPTGSKAGKAPNRSGTSVPRFDLESNPNLFQ